jgi:superfamily I DNA and/or RNA helicase
LCLGGEWDYVIFSLVRSLPEYRIEPNPTHGWCIENLGFITDDHQVNVALTRARKGLILIGKWDGVFKNNEGATFVYNWAIFVEIIILVYFFCSGNEKLMECDELFASLLKDYRRNGCVVKADSFPPKGRRKGHKN